MLLFAFRVAQNVAPAPDGFDVVVAARGGHQFLAQLADEDIDDLHLRLVHDAIEVIVGHMRPRRDLDLRFISHSLIGGVYA